MTMNRNRVNLGFENQLWAAADKMRGHINVLEYKHVAIGWQRGNFSRRRHNGRYLYITG